jgi:DNA-binding transcriptional MerR regulator
VKPHVLRYWEQEFPQLKPVKRRGNRRYYQRQDVLVIRQIRALLYDEGFTIGGARHRLEGEEAREDLSHSQQVDPAVASRARRHPAHAAPVSHREGGRSAIIRPVAGHGPRPIRFSRSERGAAW